MSQITLQQLTRRTLGRFERVYGEAPVWVAAAPGRVNLIGEHTDYNGGFVCPLAIDRYTVIAAGPAAGEIHLHSAGSEAEARFPLVDPVPRGEPAWSNYVRGVIAGMQRWRIDVPAFSAVIESSVPLGSGLSSSAALELATATLIEAMAGTELDPIEKALLCQQAEHNYADMPCGIMDQYISALGQEGHALLIDCKDNTARQVTLGDPDIVILIASTNVKHELTGSEYPTRRAQCEAAAKEMGHALLRDATLEELKAARPRLDDVTYRRAHHVITENARTLDAVAAMERRDWAAVGQLMAASHRSLRDDFEVSCAELDTMVAIADAIGLAGGVFGSRMTGGGFGGCTVSIVHAANAPNIARHMAAEYRRRTGIAPLIFDTPAVDGARVVAC